MLSYAQVLAEILQFLQDSGAAIFATAETLYGIENELKTISRSSPQIVDVIYKIESRTGTDVTGTASSLTDSVKAQFVATDATEEKVVYNSTYFYFFLWAFAPEIILPFLSLYTPPCL